MECYDFADLWCKNVTGGEHISDAKGSESTLIKMFITVK